MIVEDLKKSILTIGSAVGGTLECGTTDTQKN